MAREFFCAYHSYLEAIEPLSMEERGRLFTACLAYSRTGELLEMPGSERYVFPSLKGQIDRDREAYGDFCQRQSERGRLGGRPRKEDTSADEKTLGFFQNPTVFEKAKEKEKEKAKEKETREKDASSNASSLSQEEGPGEPAEGGSPMPQDVQERIEAMRRRLYETTGVYIPRPKEGETRRYRYTGPVARKLMEKDARHEE